MVDPPAGVAFESVEFVAAGDEAAAEVVALPLVGGEDGPAVLPPGCDPSSSEESAGWVAAGGFFALALSHPSP